MTNISHERTAIIVLGMHWSGTSLLEGTLSKLGCDTPQRVVSEIEFDRLGSVGAMNIQNLNDRVLENGGSSWFDWQEFEADWITHPQAAKYYEMGADAVVSEFTHSSFFVLQDPRMCRLLEFWRPLLEREQINPVFVFSHRNPIEVARSLRKREGWPETYALLLWLRHMLDAEFHTRGYGRSFISFDRLANDWHNVISKIQTDTGFVFPEFSDQTEAEVADFLGSNLKCYNEQKFEDSSDPIIPSWVARSFQVFEKWALHGEDVADHALLDSIRIDFNRATPVLETIVDGFMQSSKEISKEHEKLVSCLQQEFSVLEARNANLKEQVGEAQNEAELHIQRAHDLKVAHAQVARIKQKLTESERLVEAGLGKLDVARREIRVGQVIAERQKEDMLMLGLRSSFSGQSKGGLVGRLSFRVKRRLKSISRHLSARHRAGKLSR